jgi:hypothetical protein
MSGSSNTFVNIDVGEVAKFIFENDNKEIYINIQSLKTKKQLFFFIFDLFCKGIIILFGDGKRMCLNSLSLEQFDEIKIKMKNAHLLLNMCVYDKDIAVLLDMIPENLENQEKNIIQKSINKITMMEDDLDLKEYIFHLYMNDALFCISFDIIR